jgi:hypothetical protein
MLSVYDTQARKLVRELGKSVLVRDDQPIAEGLEVHQYHGYYPRVCGKRSYYTYSQLVSTGCEMIYTRKGENVAVCEIVAFLLPKEFPKTYAFLLKIHHTENEIVSRLNSSLFGISQNQDLITKTSPGKYIISEQVRKERILPDCLNIRISNLDSPLAVKQL